MEHVEDSTIAADDDLSPTRLFQRLRGSEEFVRLFRERAGSISMEAGRSVLGEPSAPVSEVGDCPGQSHAG